MNPSRPLFLSCYNAVVKACGCFAVPWMQRQPVRNDWAVGDGDWVWNGAGQPQGIWTGLMNLFETCRGHEQWGSPWGHVYSEPSRACRMPIHFPSNLSKCSAASGCHWALSLWGEPTNPARKAQKKSAFSKRESLLISVHHGVFASNDALCCLLSYFSSALESDVFIAMCALVGDCSGRQHHVSFSSHAI